MIAQVIINTQSNRTDKKFDYLIPDELEDKVTLGTRVYVPFGKRAVYPRFHLSECAL